MVLTITCNQFTAAIDNIYYAVLDDPTEGLNTVDLCTRDMHILNTYAQISKTDLDDTMTDYYSGINSSHPLAIYTRKQEKCQVFATDAGGPFSDKTMITTGTKHALACSNMLLAWHKWKCCPPINHTWPNWKAHWTATFAEMHDINRMTAGNTEFGANQATELNQAQQMASSLKNLVNATIQKNTTIKNLVATNATLTKAIADIQLSVTQMCAAAVPTSPAPTTPTPSAPLTGVTPNLLGTRSGTAGRMVTRSRLAIPAPHECCAKPAISLAQPRQTSWVAVLTMLDTLPPLHPPPDEAHQQTFIPSPLLV
jgi:hypothetical protein